MASCRPSQVRDGGHRRIHPDRWRRGLVLRNEDDRSRRRCTIEFGAGAVPRRKARLVGRRRPRRRAVAGLRPDPLPLPKYSNSHTRATPPGTSALYRAALSDRARREGGAHSNQAPPRSTVGRLGPRTELGLHQIPPCPAHGRAYPKSRRHGVFLGLDPIVEQSSAQLSLPL